MDYVVIYKMKSVDSYGCMHCATEGAARETAQRCRALGKENVVLLKIGADGEAVILV